jgi:hypothetical protein
MRLELEDFRPAGVSLKDRWREVALLYADQVEASDAMLFYDFHTLLACLYGDQVNSQYTVNISYILHLNVITDDVISQL